MAKRRNRLPQDPVEATIDSLSHEGRGIATVDGKKIFIDGGLPGEKVLFKYTRKKSKHAEGYVLEVLNDSDKRIQPKCNYFLQCGGCSLQHLSVLDQILHKQNVLVEQLQHIGGVKAQEIIQPLMGPEWSYRRKARLGAKYVLKKNSLLVGFREKRSSFVVEMDRCEVLHETIGTNILALKALIMDLDIYDKIPQIEVAVAENITALIFRHLIELSDTDVEKLDKFQKELNISVFLQSGGPDTVTPLNNETATDLCYHLENYDLQINFKPNDFTQVNFEINKKMIDRVVSLLEPDSKDNILDLFCGLGNFSLPLARLADFVTAAEAVPDLIDRAKQNAELNSIGNVNFISGDLMQDKIPGILLDSVYDKILIDPPRTGALEIINQLNLSKVKKLVYVSCNPATLARDAGVLVKEKGMKLIKAGVMDMFPHTSHVESIALFEH
jgi:23S rRNA (uracil1939-C5)-methyltransferase